MATLVNVFVQSPPASGRTNSVTARNAAMAAARTRFPRSTASADRAGEAFSAPAARATLTGLSCRPRDRDHTTPAEPQEGHDGQYERRHSAVLRQRLIGRG